MTIGANYNHKNASLVEKQDAMRQESLYCLCRRLEERGMAEEGINADITARPSNEGRNGRKQRMRFEIVPR